MDMNLKGIMQTLGAKPGQVVSNPYVRAFAPTPTPIKEAEGEDHEVSMAQNALDSIIKAATELKGKIGEGEKDIPAWIQDHITNSENYISQAASNYHEYTAEAGINGAPRFPSLDGTANESINEIEYKDALDKFNKDLEKNSQVAAISKHHGKSIKDVVKALQPYIKVLRYNDKSIKLVSIDFRDTVSDTKVHVSQTYQQNESVNEGKFKKDDLVYNTRTKTVGIVRMGDDKYGEVKTDADGNVSVDELEKYNPIKHKHQQNAKVAPSTEKEVNSRGLFNPFKAESLRLTKLK